MSDKSFGDHTNRNIVKNPLLSSAVTGLSIEDLTHKAVLLPVTPSQGQITRPDQQHGTQARTLAHSEHDKTIFPSGDALSNIAQSNAPPKTNPNILDSQINVKLDKNRSQPGLTQSKASVKSDDDFDVNEYIARLQGTRYVSAPLHSHLKEDKNANLEATEENLEEINLNESQNSVEVQQSLTADIAQNFSQLPTVLPHVASAVFSSFSNMLSYKSREQTPDVNVASPESEQRDKGGYGEVQFQSPDVGVPLNVVEDTGPPKEVAPPPKEPPSGGIGNFRITTKKKYAQIPGLSSGETAQPMAFSASNQNIAVAQNFPPMSQYMPPIGQDMPPIGQNMPPVGQNAPFFAPSMPPGQNILPTSQNQFVQNVVATSDLSLSQNIPPIGHNVPIGQNMPPSSENIIQIGERAPPPVQNMPPIGQNVPTIFNPNESKTTIPDGKSHDSIRDGGSETNSQYNLFNPIGTDSQHVSKTTVVTTMPNMPITKDNPSFFTPIEHKEQNIPQANVPSAPIIPPPLMFSNLPSRDRESQSSTGKSVLPPSVARRISANQPIIKPQVSTPSFTENIFVPAPVPEASIASTTQTGLSTAFTASAFVPTYTPATEPIGPPVMTPQMNAPNIPAQPQGPAFFIPKTETVQSVPEIPTFFTPKDIAPFPSESSATLFTSKDTTLPPPTSASGYPTNISSSPFGSTAPNVPPVSNIGHVNAPIASSIFNPGAVPPQSAAPSIFQPSPQNLPPTFFNPSQLPECSKDAQHPITRLPPTATPEPTKPLAEPPKAAGTNFRMTKKRPQYYAGPIEGVGAISNNVKPVIPPVMPPKNVAPSTVQSLFTPEPVQQVTEQYTAPNVEQASVPFDISRPMETVSHAPFDISTPSHEYSPYSIQPSKNYEQEYNTAFDLSRATTEAFDPPKPKESKGFGIIGSLKSKLSAIDINKIQSSVTTFFDPAYNANNAPRSGAEDNVPMRQQYDYGQQQIGQAQGQGNFEIFVPNVEQNQYSHQNIAYSYDGTNQYYQTQDPYFTQSQAPDLYSTSSYFSDPNITQHPSHSQSLTVSATVHVRENIPKQAENKEPPKLLDQTAFYNPNAFAQENMSKPYIDQIPSVPPQSVDQIAKELDNVIKTENVQESVTFFDPNAFKTNVMSDIDNKKQPETPSSQFQQNIEAHNPATSIIASDTNQSMTFFNPNAFKQEIPQIPQSGNQPGISSSHSLHSIGQDSATNVAPVKSQEDMTYYNPSAFTQDQKMSYTPQQPYNISASDSQSNPEHNKEFTLSSDQSQENITFYNPGAFTIPNQEIDSNEKPSIHQGDFERHIHRGLTSNIPTSDAQIDPLAYDSALNTNKYNLSNIQTPPKQSLARVPLVPAANFFDNTQTLNLPQFPPTTLNVTDFDIPDNNLFQGNAKPEELNQEPFEFLETSQALVDIPPIGTKAKIEIKSDDINKKREDRDREQQPKERNLIESLTKDDIPILGVSTVPLFGLSAMIADKSKEVSDAESEIKNIPLLDTKPFRNLFEGNVSVSFFENMTMEKKQNENQTKEPAELDISGLTISDVKNVLLMEPPQENIGAVLKRNASSNKLEGQVKPEQVSPEHFTQQNDSIQSTAFNEKAKSMFEDRSEKFFIHSSDSVENLEQNKDLDKDDRVEKEDEDGSELNICETCREVNTPDFLGYETRSKEKEDFTTQLIENITSRIQLSHSLTVPLTESEIPVDGKPQVDCQQLQEITDIAEDTFETLQVQSATELLDDEITNSQVRNYGWTQDAANSSTAMAHDYGFKIETDGTDPIEQDYGFKMEADTSAEPDQDYEFKLDPNAIGFFGSNSLFFDNLPKNASDEIKAEIKNSHEDIPLARQMSIPSAPPAEDDTKSDETGGLDVHSIEQDAKKDFPLDEEFIIEPSETDDDKIEFRERKRSSEDSTVNDTFTNRVERFKKATDFSNDEAFEQKVQGFNSQPVSMASYFDTGNYAVESHYRNSLTSMEPWQGKMRIPPGFEEQYARVLSELTGDIDSEPFIPDTSTQTRTTATPTYTSPQDVRENVIGFEMRRRETTEALETKAEAIGLTTEPVPTLPLFADTTAQAGDNFHNVESLPDPINFLSASTEETKPPSAEPQDFNRLASYFSMPPAQPDHAKSFFELSQSQNHYRHETNALTDSAQKSVTESNLHQDVDDVTRNNIANLMKDLTSPRNLKKQTVTNANYFTVETNNYINHKSNANPIKINTENLTSKIDTKDDVNAKVDPITVINDCDDIGLVIQCQYCLKNIPGINSKDFKVRTAVNKTADSNTGTDMTSERDSDIKKSVTVTFGHATGEDSHDGVSIHNEHRLASEYTAVKHHWFYRVDVEEKSVWRGFSVTDSRALEDTYHSPDLTDSTLVATDGGRYDVNINGRIRIAVYWSEKPTNVRRCSWFYKGTTDVRYVPYTEAVAEKLEEEYRHGITTGEWHRRLSLPNSEMVIMHGPSVMVHFLHSGATDAFSAPPNLLGKRVYRNSPKIKMARDERLKVDHLVMMVHGIGEYKRNQNQATSRPRVVRRGFDESEIEDCEPSSIDHLLLLCHGVGSACDLRFRSVEEVVEDFRATSLQLLQSHYKNSYDNGVVSRVEILPISWHDQLHSGETGVDSRLSRITLDSIPRLRAFTNHTVLDVLFYTSPVFHQTIIDTVCSELNRIYGMFIKRNPHFKGNVSLGGHSLGSVILYDLLCNQIPQSPSRGERSKLPSQKTYVPGTAEISQLNVNYPQLTFAPAALYALGSPIAIFECIRGVESLGMDFALPTCKHFFNIFHPYDPIAYRIEPLISSQLQDVKPYLIPHHKGRKRMHLELKDTMARVGADLKQKLIESVRTTWNKWKACPPNDGQLEKVVEEEIEKEQLCEDGKDEHSNEMEATPDMLGQLNSGRRVDYVLQEAPLEMINEYLFAMSSHVGYWESEDTMLLMLREIYSSLGVQPDSTVPQQCMTVQRTRTTKPDEASIVNENESPSTSRSCT